MSYFYYAIFYSNFTTYFCKYLPILFNEGRLISKYVISTGQNDGMRYLLFKIIQKIFVPVYFLLFWIITFVSKVYSQMLIGNWNNHEWYYVIMSAANNVYLSPISLISTAITVTYISCFLLSLIKIYLWGSNTIITQNFVNLNLNRDHNGWEEGMTTLLLTSMTVLTDMNDSTRMAVLALISFVVLSSLLQSMLEISEPAILSLNTNYSHNKFHHFKVLLLCAFLFYFPLYVTYLISQVFPFNFWIAVVFSTSLLISARVIHLVVIHCLFWWDSCKNEPRDDLDEIVYFVRAVTKILEFLISISVLIVGVWETLHYKSNIMNSSILILHCYFNVWQRIQEGFSSYTQRKEANRLVQSLKTVDDEQTSKCEDLCSICYVAMKETKKGLVLTQCNHIFHRVCIRKWLCIQNRCPLCTSIVVDKSKC